MFGLEAADGRIEGSDESHLAWILRGCIMIGPEKGVSFSPLSRF
jgi:hypothetical protein